MFGDFCLLMHALRQYCPQTLSNRLHFSHALSTPTIWDTAHTLRSHVTS